MYGSGIADRKLRAGCKAHGHAAGVILPAPGEAPKGRSAILADSGAFDLNSSVPDLNLCRLGVNSCALCFDLCRLGVDLWGLSPDLRFLGVSLRRLFLNLCPLGVSLRTLGFNSCQLFYRFCQVGPDLRTLSINSCGVELDLHDPKASTRNISEAFSDTEPDMRRVCRGMCGSQIETWASRYDSLGTEDNSAGAQLDCRSDGVSRCGRSRRKSVGTPVSEERTDINGFQIYDLSQPQESVNCHAAGLHMNFVLLSGIEESFPGNTSTGKHGKQSINKRNETQKW